LFIHEIVHLEFEENLLGEQQLQLVYVPEKGGAVTVYLGFYLSEDHFNLLRLHFESWFDLP